MSIFNRKTRPSNILGRLEPLTDEDRLRLGVITVPDRATINIKSEEELENRIQDQEDFAEWMEIKAEQQREYEENN